MKIYTKTGDQGKTRLIGGECVDKYNPRVECYGTVDELNSHIGLAIQWLENEKPLQPLLAELLKIQHELFNLGSLLACEKSEQIPLLPAISMDHVNKLENSIDQMTLPLPALKNFILPGGSLPAAQLHIARTVCRRAERLSVELIGVLRENLSPVELENLEVCLIYLNRLSDYLFTAARFTNLRTGRIDQIWQK
jgi:cob(I)alamin adenosyltransferase